MDRSGLLLCAKYSVAPNFYGYCGPEQNKNLVDHLKDNIADREVEHILSEFETLYLYLRLIAVENKIVDFFDRRVVEAYWLGNSLLHNIKDANYASLLKEKFWEKKKLDDDNFSNIKSRVLTYPFLPHHSFHVFNIFRRTGNVPSLHTLETMDQCRIGWGRIKIKNDPPAGGLKMKNIIVKTKPLQIKNNKLILGKPVLKEARYDYKGVRFINDLKEGDCVSIHWGFVCDVLNQNQVKNLEYYTQKSINFYNASD